jgi:hypothetical protein
MVLSNEIFHLFMPGAMRSIVLQPGGTELSR